jgi:hypothetical protein
MPRCQIAAVPRRFIRLPRVMCVAIQLALMAGLTAPAHADDTVAAALSIARENGARVLYEKPRRGGLRVLILCDSMGLNGFADELDACFRACPGVERVHTIVACGSNPLTWMKRGPYASATTHCGFLRIDSTGEPGGIQVERDIYGIPAGNKPATHRVPKIEDLVREIQPDILVFQNGNNFFDFYKGAQGDPDKARGQMRSFITPLNQWLASSAPSIRHFYWVTPPQTGAVSDEVQQAVFDIIRQEVEPAGRVIDSRQITSYPYKAQGADLMHFWGDEAFAWGRDCFRWIASDLGNRRGGGRQQAPQLAQAPPPKTAPPAKDTPREEVRRAIPVEDEDEVLVRVRLEKLNPIPGPEAFAPYGELLVAGLYRVVEVKSGRYDEKYMVILHPAYINHQKQPVKISRWRSHEFRVRELGSGSLWATTRRADSIAPFELMPFLLLEDEARHPGNAGWGRSGGE